MKRRNDLFIEKNGDIYTVLMTPELQEDIGTLGFVEFTKEDHVSKEDALANVEASKMVMEIQSPLTGTIVAVNREAEETPTLLNSTHREENWLVQLAEVDEAEFNALEEV